MSRVLNFLWLNLDLPAPPDPADGSIRQPIPPKYIANIRTASAAHPETQMVLWVDSRRLTERQYAFLQDAIEEDRPNVYLKDLRSIPAYDAEPLFNQAETNPNWRRGGQTALIWRQVDAAKILISLQGDFDQSFFADLDHAHLDIAGEKVQAMLRDHGLMVGSSSSYHPSIENQLWGFTREGRKFFEEYYDVALKCAYRGENAWDALTEKVRKDLCKRKGIKLADICLLIDGDGTRAEQPGHQWSMGTGSTGAPAIVAKGDLTRVFNEKSAVARQPCPGLDVVWKPQASPGTYSQSAIFRMFTRVRDTLKTSVGLA